MSDAVAFWRTVARAASPYPPLPPEIPGDHVVFTQPIAARR